MEVEFHFWALWLELKRLLSEHPSVEFNTCTGFPLGHAPLVSSPVPKEDVAAIVCDAAGRVLMRKARDACYLSFPPSHLRAIVQPREFICSFCTLFIVSKCFWGSFSAVAKREVVEETGLEPVARLLRAGTLLLLRLVGVLVVPDSTLVSSAVKGKTGKVPVSHFAKPAETESGKCRK